MFPCSFHLVLFSKYMYLFVMFLVEKCEADSTTKSDSDITVVYSDSESDDDGPLFVFNVSSDLDDENQHGNYNNEVRLFTDPDNENQY